MNRYLKLYSKKYFLTRILECSEEELAQAKGEKGIVCIEDRIPKKGGFRSIVSVKPGSSLAKLQKKLYKNYLSQIPVSTAAKGFVKGCSYVNFLEEHVGHSYFLRVDISDFFDSITKEKLAECLEPFAEKEIADEIMELCTWNGKVPQGFSTSPALSNLVFRRIDQRVRKYCRSYHKEMDRRIFYTRYADDMLFSSAGTLEFDFCKNKNFKRMIAHILHQNGFSCNESKTIYAKGEISLSGYVVSNDVHLSRQKLCNINEVIYQFDQRKSYGSISYSLDKATVNIKNIMCNLNKRKMKKADGTVIQFDSLSDLVYYAAGCRSYLMQIASTEHGDTGYDKQIAKKIRKLEMILDYLSEELGEV